MCRQTYADEMYLVPHRACSTLGNVKWRNKSAATAEKARLWKMRDR